MRQRGERIERSFAHLYDTGGMRRTHLRGHTNILKRLLIHAGGFNLGLVMHRLIGSGTPRGLQVRPATVIDPLLVFLRLPKAGLPRFSASLPRIAAVRWFPSLITITGNSSPQPLTPRAAKPACLESAQKIAPARAAFPVGKRHPQYLAVAVPVDAIKHRAADHYATSRTRS
jgi:hypothetical protein